jgi:hypothetical protein
VVQKVKRIYNEWHINTIVNMFHTFFMKYNDNIQT